MIDVEVLQEFFETTTYAGDEPDEDRSAFDREIVEDDERDE